MTDPALSALTHGATVVTANNRLARSIELAFHRQQLAAGFTAWSTPLILPWRSWLERLWWQSAESSGQAGRHHLLGDAQARAVWRRLTGSDVPDHAAALASRAWRLCQDWRIPISELIREADSDDSRAFAGWAGDYLSLCDAQRWVDHGLLVPLLVQDLREGAIRVSSGVHLAGFDLAPPLLRSLLSALEQQSCSISEGAAPCAHQVSVVRTSARNEQDELELAARWARSVRERLPQATIGIVVPDLPMRIEAVRRLFLEIFSPGWQLRPGEDLPVNFSSAPALARNSIVRTAHLLLRGALGPLDYRQASELLASPYVPGWSEERVGRGRLELELRQQVGLRISMRRLVELAHQLSPRMAASLEALQKASVMQRQQGAAGWADHFRRMLNAAGWPGDRPLASDEYQAAVAFRGVVDEFRACDAQAGLVGPADALRLLETLTEEGMFQPAGNVQAVQVLGLLEAVGQQFDYLWICGLTSMGWPPGGQPNALLPISLQRRAGMPDSSPAASRERAERQLRWLVSGAANVVASWPRLRGEEPQTASPLITALKLRDAGQVEHWAGLTMHRAQFAVSGTEELSEDSAPPVQLPQRFRGGVALLERQARCPARAFLEFRLGARELAVPQSGIDPGSRGVVLHAVLERFFSAVTRQEELQALSLAEQNRLLETMIDAELRRNLPLHDPVIAAMARLERRRLLQILGTFLDSERQRGWFRVVAIEDTPAAARLPAAVTALALKLRPDRIDEVEGGGRLVIDYKTSRRPPSSRDLYGPRPRSPQLALYATAANASGVALVRLLPDGPRWMGVGESSWGIDGVQDVARFTRNQSPDWASQRAAWWGALERLAEEFLQGSFQVDRWRREEFSGQWAMAIRLEAAIGDEESEK